MSRRANNNNNMQSATSHVGGNGGGRGARRMVPASATAHVNSASVQQQQQAAAANAGLVMNGGVNPPQWAHHAAAAVPYTNADFMYRYANVANVVTHPVAEAYAPTPYMSAADVTMSRQLQRRFDPASEPKEKTVVNSQQFMQFPVIYNLDLKAAPSCVPQLASVHTQCYTTANKYNDAHVLLRRIVDCPAVTAAHAQAVYEKLRHFRHPNLVKLNGITHTNEFILGSNDLVLEYRLIKRSKGLRDAYLPAAPRRDPLTGTAAAVANAPGSASTAAANGGGGGGGSANPTLASEGQIWSFAVQLVGLVRSFHELRQPIRGLHYSKMIIVEDTNRIMFTGLGLVDLVQGFSKASTEELFAEDIRALGELLLNLCTGSADRHNHKDEALWDRLPHCSEALRRLIDLCLSATATPLILPPSTSGGAPANSLSGLNNNGNNNNNGSIMGPNNNNTNNNNNNNGPNSTNNNNTNNNNGQPTAQQNITIHDVCTLLASRISIEVGHQQGHVDYLMHECSKVQENGRMMRLMMKLNLILACEEGQQETTERYILRLFHSYVFHQVDDCRRPRLDWGHIYHCLNKLDSGSDEIIQMVSGDHEMIIVTSYDDIRALLEGLFKELQNESNRNPEAMTPITMVGSPTASGMMGTPLSMNAAMAAGMPMSGTPMTMMMGAHGVNGGVGVGGVGTPASLTQQGMRYAMFH